MSSWFTIGDVIRRARKARKWDQKRLGLEAASYRLHPRQLKINKACSIADALAYDGTHLLESRGGTIETVSSTGVAWTITEVR